MAELKITVDENTVEKARRRASEEGTSVDDLVRNYLEEYAGTRQERIEAMRRILESSRESTSGSGPGGRAWKREDAYEDRLWRYERKK